MRPSLTQESGYYPPGAEFDPRAPWNQDDPDDEDEDQERDPLDDGDTSYDQEKDDAL